MYGYERNTFIGGQKKTQNGTVQIHILLKRIYAPIPLTTDTFSRKFDNALL